MVCSLSRRDGPHLISPDGMARYITQIVRKIVPDYGESLVQHFEVD